MKSLLNFIKQLFVGLIVLFSFSNTYSQVTVNIQQPPYNQLGIIDLWKINLNNISTNPIPVYLYGTLTEGNDGLIATATSSQILLNPGWKIVNASELEPVTINYPNTNPKYKESIIRTGNMPSGNYEMCVYVKMIGSNQDLGVGCIQQTIAFVPAPTLISPVDGENVQLTQPIFTWMQAIGQSTGVFYKIKIVELRQGQSPEIAIHSNPVWFTKDNIGTTILNYPISGNEFVAGKVYAWQIQAQDLSGNPIGENIGLSEISVFNFIGISILPSINVSQQMGYYTLEKSVNTNKAKIGDELTYTIYIKKPGRINPKKVEIHDAIPEGTELVDGSVKIEQVDSDGNPSEFNKRNYSVSTSGGNLKIKIKNFPDDHYIKITFKVIIISSPEGGLVKNAGVKMKIPRFRIPGGHAGPFEYELEEGTETTVAPDVSISKTSNITECGPGDYIEYILTIENKEDHEIEITLYDLLLSNAKYLPPVKSNGDEIPSEIVADDDFNSYIKIKVTIPANSTKTITIRFKITGYGTITNKIYTGLPKTGSPDETDVEASTSVESNLETYLRNTYARELENIIEHKSIADRIHSIDDALALIENGEKTIEHDCNGTPVKIVIKWDGWGSTPIKSDNRVEGEAEMPEKWDYNNKKLEFEVNMKIQYDKILEYKYWRQNKAVFYHELLHMQLQFENWNNPRWWDDYCKKIIEWVKTKQGAPPDIVQNAEKDHEHIGENADVDGWHKDFLDELEKLNE